MKQQATEQPKVKRPRMSTIGECCIYDPNSPTEQCQEPILCRGRCRKHYLTMRRFEIEGRLAELEKLEPQVPKKEPQKPRWEWPGDEAWLVARLEALEPGIEEPPQEQQEPAGEPQKNG
jgi:hypothetical protein